jgi:outer membrane protein OmpA-like peptidoglycan-associated protein
MSRLSAPLSIAAVALLAACGGDGAASGPDTAPISTAEGSGRDASVPSDIEETDAPGLTAGDSGLGSAGVVSSEPADGSGAPFGEEQRDGDGVEFVTTSSTTSTTTTSTTLPPTTTSSTTTSTTSTSTTSTSTSTSTSTTTTVPPPTTMQCSFAADALFQPGEAVLTDQAIADLGLIVAGITDVRSVRVEGHTDHRGTDDENLALSQARADAAAAALVDAGVDQSLITAVGVGETDAHQDDPTDEEMAADRRVDVIVDAEVPITTSC